MYDPEGIDTAAVPSHDEEPEAAVTKYADNVISNDELLTLDVDVLVPCRSRKRDHRSECRCDRR